VPVNIVKEWQGKVKEGRYPIGEKGAVADSSWLELCGAVDALLSRH